MRLTVSHHGILCKSASLLIALLLVVACSSPLSPTPTAAPAVPTATPAPAATPTSPAETPTPTTGGTTSVVYAYFDSFPMRLDVHVPSQQGPWPVVVVVHGFGQSRPWFEPLARAIASQGAVVFNTDVAFGVPFLPGIEHLACAIRFARATAPDYDGDPNRITVVGNSAGAASGMVVGLAGDDFEGDCVVSDVSALPDALAVYEGPYEFATTNYGDVVDHTYLQQEDPELLEAINPYSHIGRNPDLQVRLIHGDDVDNIWYEVPPEESIESHQALADAGYDVELIVVEGDSHTALTSPNSGVFALTVEQVMELARSSSE